MAAENVMEFTDDNFQQEVLESSTPVLIDFWAEWCMPCRMLAPTIDELANDYAGRVKVGKVDTDNNREISMKFGISSIPTIIVMKDGQMVGKVVGPRGKKDLSALLDKALQ